MDYQDHPIAALFPLMTEPELKELAKDIGERGQREPIILHQTKILDGRNRYRACLMAGREPVLTTYHGTDPIRDVLSWNLHRRHLTTSQRGMVAQAALPMLEAQAKERQRDAGIHGAEGGRGNKKTLTVNSPEGYMSAESTTQAGELLGVSGDTVKKAKRIAQADPELAAKVRDGEMSLHAADQVVKQRKQEESAPLVDVQDWAVIAIVPDWDKPTRTIERDVPPDSTVDAHLFLYARHDKLMSAIETVRSWVGPEAVTAFTVTRRKADADGQIEVATDFVLHAPMGLPEFKTKPCTSAFMPLDAFWKAVMAWTDGRRLAIGFQAEGYETKS